MFVLYRQIDPPSVCVRVCVLVFMLVCECLLGVGVSGELGVGGTPAATAFIMADGQVPQNCQPLIKCQSV